jgi:transcriptional regulator with XRE-family HTH domain
MTTVAFLDAVRVKHGLDSDNKLARLLRVDRTRISAYRNGRRTLDPEACVAVAAALELPPEHVFAAVQAERAKRTDHRKIWERLARLAKHAGAAAVVGLIVSTSAPTSSRATEAAARECIFCQIRRGGRGRPERRSSWRPRRRRTPRTAAVA